MKKASIYGAVLLGALLLTSRSSYAQIKEKTAIVGEATMYPSKNIVENAINSKDHTTLIAAVKAAGLVETLSSAGLFTVFAPTNAAFEGLPGGTVDNLLKPENKKMLTDVLTYHVVAGYYTVQDIWALIAAGNGKAELKSVHGGKLIVWAKDKDLFLRDSKGNEAKITIGDVDQSNGVIHVVDRVMMPSFSS
ncbi:fasciclin domain-containing protein [Sphingobacterium sp. JB170]|uniref:fasciclin domain-containing protein n=1 Tax=Sphingobacterium sp. JB170 TaxID=1434842 RepID=UPI000B35D73D|nr:fasciclin domain-containing protein [Sphingobacterium sp. JB170]